MDNPKPNRQPIVVGVLITALVLLISGVLFLRDRRAESSANAAAPAFAERFLGLMVAGDPASLDEAWSLTSTELKSYMGKETLRQTLNPGRLAGLAFDRQESHNENGLKGVRCYLRGATQVQICLTLSREKDSWKVEKVEVAMPAAGGR